MGPPSDFSSKWRSQSELPDVLSFTIFLATSFPSSLNLRIGVGFVVVVVFIFIYICWDLTPCKIESMRVID